MALGIAGLLALATLLPTAAHAQFVRQRYVDPWGGIVEERVVPYGYGGYGGYGGYWGDTNAAFEGTANGVVRDLDFARGRLSLQAGDGERTVTFNARPEDLAGLTQGDVVTIAYRNYQDQLWLAPGGGYGGASGYFGAESFANYGELRGTVTSVDRGRGRLEVAGRTLRAHPEQLSDLFPGQFVEVTYVAIGGNAWLDSFGGGYGFGGYGGGFGGYGGGYGGGWGGYGSGVIW